MAELVELSKRDIKLSLEHDPEFFINFFLEDELTFPVPEFHKDIFLLMTIREVIRFVCAIPRDHAKTTLARLAVVWYFLFSDYRFIIYVSSSLDLAVFSVNAIVNFIESDNFKSVFGEVEWITKQDGKGIYVFILEGKTCILKAFGAGQHVRGINVDNKRPQLAILDDIEDEKNIATEQLFKKLKRWLYGPFIKALDKFHNKVIHLGNMISNMSMLDEHCRSEYWKSRRYGALLKDGKPLWPDAWPIDKLKEDFRQYQSMGLSDVWFAEMMNLPIALGKGLIRPEQIYYKPMALPGEIEYGFITVDLAISENTWAHETVCAAHGWNGECWQILEYEHATGIDTVYLFYQIIIPMMQRWQFNYCGIEDEAFQASLKYTYAHLALLNNIDGVFFVPCKSYKQAKVQRLAPWADMIKAKEYALTEGDFSATQQLLGFDPTTKKNQDDIIDCCAYGPQMIQYYLIDIIREMEKIRGIDHSQNVISCYQASPV